MSGREVSTMSATGRFEYLLAEYLHLVEENTDPRWAVPIVQAMWQRWPDRWRRWIGRHPEDVPEVIRFELFAAGLDELLEGWDEDGTDSESDVAVREGRGVGVLKSLHQTQVQAA
jgi:hypothetical protein